MKKAEGSTNEQPNPSSSPKTSKPIKRFGFMKGQGVIPEGDGFKTDFKDYIEDLFGLNEPDPPQKV